MLITLLYHMIVSYKLSVEFMRPSVDVSIAFIGYVNDMLMTSTS